MTDQEIVALYWNREERAIEETDHKYGAYCGTIARNILRNLEDAKECVKDTWMHTWSSVPPHRPAILSSYLGTITRNLSISRYRAANAQKRRGDRLTVAYEELQESLPAGNNPEEDVNAKVLGEALNRFLAALPPKDACLLLRRYWYLDSMAQIARRYGMPEGSVRSRLHRLREKLRVYLEQEGFTV